MAERDKREAERLSAVVLESLDEESVRGQLPRRAFRSRTQFYRLFRALIEETPEAMRRRLLLERAAWQLSRTRLSVTEIALEASYGSLEAFTRAFRKAFRVSPSLYRRMGAQPIHLPAPNGFHFWAPGSKSEGALAMDLFDRFSGTDTWHTKRLLEAAAGLTDAQLDKRLGHPAKLLPWEKEPESLRAVLERLVYTKEVWAAALLGGEFPEEKKSAEDLTPAALLARFEKADGDFLRALAEVRSRGGWDDTFIDALCEPAETFTFGGMFAHVITFNTYRRLSALGMLRDLGVKVEGFGCPTEYEMAVAPWRPVEVAR